MCKDKVIFAVQARMSRLRHQHKTKTLLEKKLEFREFT